MDKRNCDALGINNFYTAQQLTFMSEQLSGDVVVRPQPMTFVRFVLIPDVAMGAAM